VSPVVREDGSGTNTYNIEAISDSDSDSSDSDENNDAAAPQNFARSSPIHVPLSPVYEASTEVLPSLQPDASLHPTNDADDVLMEAEYSDIEALSDNDSSSSSSSSDSNSRLMNISQLISGFSETAEPIDSPWSSSSSSDSGSNEAPPDVIQADEQEDQI
jgi:hypothetical protein